MKKAKIFTLFFLLFYLSFSPLIFAQVSRLAQAIEKYAQGKLEEAIPDFESVLTEDKENKKIQMYLVNCLVAVGTKYLKEQNYSKALPYLERAIQLVPEDKEVKEVFQMLKTKIAPPVAVVPQPRRSVGVLQPLPPKKEVVVKPPEPTKVVPQPVVKEVKPVKEAVKQPPAVVKQPLAVVPQPSAVPTQVPTVVTEPPVVAPPPAVVKQPPAAVERVAQLTEDFEKKVELLIARFEKQREELLRGLEEWEKMVKKEKEYLTYERKITTQRTILIVGLSLLLFTFLLILPVYRTARHSAEVKDKVLEGFKDKISKIVDKEKGALREFISQEADTFSKSLDESLTKIKQETEGIERKRKEEIKKEKPEEIPVQPKLKEEIIPPVVPPQRPAVVPQPQLVEEVLTSLIISSEDILEGLPPDLRLEAIKVLEKNLSNEDSIERLVAMRLLESFLDDENELVQMRAIECLKKYAPEKIFESVRKMTYKKRKFSSQLMRMVSDLPLKEETEILISLQEHPDPNIRKKAANILNRLREEARKFSS